ncbi:MAG: glucan phosphoethanolaminetransferase (alkaline phosphatase superfamily) [Saprospiraceae bacterium]|jgi:glucan phosphoethanolaminetransferase (alkaline phosphatase superfamily)
MIQRIQSIFLLLAAACAFCLFAFPFGTTESPVIDSSIYDDGIYNIQDSVALLALFCVAGGLTFISIFLFKNRRTQLLLGRLAIIANIIGFIMVLIFYFNNASELQNINDEENVIGFSLPIAFLVFAFLSQWYINKDEKLVSSMDRLR